MILFLKHITIEGPGTLEAFFKEQGVAFKIVELEQEESFTDEWLEAKAVICLGGPMNVYEEDRYPFLVQENRFLRKIIEQKIPFLGICLGSQLLAKACGARVTRAQEQEIGFYDVALTRQGKADPLLKGLGPIFKVFQWHEDTFDVPQGAQLLAWANDCAHQGFRMGLNAYGLQFHIEVTKPMIMEWIKAYWKNPDATQAQKAQDILVEYDKIQKQFDANARQIYGNFLKLI